jgi:uncharacterized membrane protein
MSPSPLHYFPVSPFFVLLLFGLLVLLAAVIQLKLVTYAYEKIGVSRRHIMFLLLMSLVGSAINIPVAEVPVRNIMLHQMVDFFGMRYVIPQIEHHGRMIIAVNLGGALIPLGLSLYLLLKNGIYWQSLVGIAVIAGLTHSLARPVPGIGIAVPTLLPPILAAGVALIISRKNAAPLAYVAGCLGTLIGADILNLGNLEALGAPIVSIGGAGISDGVFLTGIVAVLLA